MAFSADGALLASGGVDHAVRLWRTSDGRGWLGSRVMAVPSGRWRSAQIAGSYTPAAPTDASPVAHQIGRKSGVYLGQLTSTP